MAAVTLTLTNLIPTIYEAMDIVARERVGLIPAVSRNSNAERAAKDQSILSPVVGTMAAEDLEVDNVSSSAPNQTISNVELKITKSRSVPFGINAEQQRGLINAGTYATINRDRIAQAIRTLTNEIESDLAGLHIHASRAVGTYNAVPFATAADLTDFANMAEVLEENGAPSQDWHVGLGSRAMNNLRGKQSSLFKVNEAGTDELLRDGTLGVVENFNIHPSKQIKRAVTIGTAADATTNTTGYAIGETEITLASAGTGSILAGDIITFAGDPHQYVVKVGDAQVSNGGTITLAEPGLQQAIPAAATNITVVGAT
ncbi:P22 phage major capsid protein family protein, partial [Nitrosomonas communis]|uniref:P22 phage major capsid protein family protein n=1 Tax=Nitrosomonas communis TaxID=44574 RepID=UPI0026F14D59